jgi:microcystin-dependent protein
MKLPKLVSLLLFAAASPCMAQTFYLGQVLTFPYTFCPVNTMPASGQLLQISQYTALFSLLGTFYGGDGTSTFALPNIRPPLTENRWPLITCIALTGIFPSRN